MNLHKNNGPSQEKYTPRRKRGAYKKHIVKKNLFRAPVVQPNDPSIRYISLTRGMFAIVNAFLYEWLITFNWHAVWSVSSRKFYAARSGRNKETGKKYSILMHQQIINRHTSDKRVVDHENENGLDNRGQNMRFATKIQNGCNRGKTILNTSGFKGVSWVKSREKWVAQIQYEGKTYNLGRFMTKEEAARTYDRAAIKYFGAFAVLNFPRSDYD